MPSDVPSTATAHESLSTPICCALAVVSFLILVVSFVAIAYGMFRCVRRFHKNPHDGGTEDIEAQVAELKELPSSPDIPASIIKLLALSQHSHIPIVTDAILTGPIPIIPRFTGPLSRPEGSRCMSEPKSGSLKIDTPVELRTRRLLVDPKAFTPSRPVPSRPPPLYTLPVRPCPSSIWADLDTEPVADWESLFGSGFAPTIPFTVITREKVFGLVEQSAHVPVGALKTKYKEKAVESQRIASSAKRGAKVIQTSNGRKKIIWKDMQEKPAKKGKENWKENTPTATHVGIPRF